MSNPFVNTALSSVPFKLGHRIKPKVCTQNWDTAGFRDWLLFLHRKEPFVRCRIVNICQCFNSSYSWNLRVFRAKATTLFAGEMLFWHLWGSDWWSAAHTCSHLPLAPSSELLASLFPAWHIPDADMKDVATGLEGKKEAFIPLSSSYLPSTGNLVSKFLIRPEKFLLLPNSWITRSLRQGVKSTPFPSICCEICVITPQPPLPQCFAPTVSHKTASTLTQHSTD